jgi:hypothetical protein
MSREAVEYVLDRWINDAAFREALRADPEAAIRQAGIELDPAEWAAVRNATRLPDDHRLDARENKAHLP